MFTLENIRSLKNYISNIGIQTVLQKYRKKFIYFVTHLNLALEKAFVLVEMPLSQFVILIIVI